jgi:D-ribose pyranase
VLRAIRANFVVGHAYMAEQFRARNDEATRRAFEEALQGIPVSFEPHEDFKKRVPAAVGLIRTGDSIQYANIILESA